MFLKSVTYSEFSGKPQEWRLECMTLGQKNLIVGKNSTGKTRALNIIGGMARHLSTGAAMPISSDYKVLWVHEGKEYIYELVVEDNVVVRELLSIDGKSYLERKEGGTGSIWAEQIGEGQYIPFQTPPNELAIFKRRDTVQHSFIEPVYNWASQVRHYRFGSNLGKDHLTIFVPNGPAVDERDENQVAGIFRDGIKYFGEEFERSIINDMQQAGYSLERIILGAPVSFRVEGAPGELSSIQVLETGLTCITDQFGMSQGMYRVLALFVHVNYLQFKGASTCIVVDDIGEGLDYERACSVIRILRDKADRSDVQVIMSTNDRFVMNEVPLKEWTVLSRAGSNVHVYNYENSSARFDEFRYTGLSNFSFFEMDYLETGASED